MTSPVGMVRNLEGYGGPTDDQIAFARAYLADGELDAAMTALQSDPQRQAERKEMSERRKAEDWAQLGHYRAANADLKDQNVETVFIGDSITEMWAIAQPDLFSNGVVNRGVSGQTSPQILLRFMADVIALRPKAVHLMCGVNDIAGNTGPTTPEDFKNNVCAMLDLARTDGIAVILGSITPITALPWAIDVGHPGAWVSELNGWLKTLAEDRGLTYVDYFTCLADDDGSLRSDLTRDGVHPQRSAYALMRDLLNAVLRARGGE